MIPKIQCSRQTYQTFGEDKEICRVYVFTPLVRPATCSSCLGGESDFGRAGTVEHYELRLEEDVTVDREANAGI